MGIESQGPTRPAGNLTPKQVETFQKVEPKALGSIQIIIAVLCLCLSITILQLYEEVHFSPDVIVVVVIVVQLLVSGSILIHAGRFPSLFWVKATLVAHLVSAAFSTAVLGLLSRHLPYRQDTYHCEHCRRLEIYAVQQYCFRKCSYNVERNCKLLIDGFLATLVLFLVVELAICIVTILFGLNALAKGGVQLPGFRQRAAPSEAITPRQPQVLMVSEVEPMSEREPEPRSEPTEEIPSPPTEPQVAPIDSLTDV
ncbi:uncharacterized protein LOC109077562 isoform X1 [Cyprinus carpio]|uniref:Uncharacterized LOC109077562 n=1 Tax=Cyprinus carpio TaxID=7962 RepID=A0A8C2EIB5_CYPCA|nr:uncharacterized protein LOC109077562 isoform X1 [Cyprinus carpio]XP_018948656.1 uncharacterized protein LOC109077562 isoform X1 [Cyprinus carpio]XP_018948657.1 uncharacterized protein LOC109077562 isoform X1 [Cyprinus carpio]XP_018948659.1 uncharacterized protein LOC109077562 isoform X1 [Cyprinus carpio]XP_042632632.1 uncharacterized protein LOC109077562 isoform X1 [Cyprinus carpio]XP_042632633.1 uncharacterized protein LOC109077562 isoform X1 [Cyprinus carpio]